MPILLLRDRALLILIALLGRHLAREDSGGDGVDADLDARIRDLGGEHAGDMVGGALAGVVGEVVLGLEHDAGDGGDVDDAGGEAGGQLARFLQQGQEGGGHEVELRDVGLVDVGPVVELGGFVVEEVLLEILGGGVLALLGVGLDAGVVDEDAEALLARGDLVDEVLDVFLAGDVGY